MGDKGFNIESLLDFNTPSYFCERCYGLLWQEPTGQSLKSDRAVCPVCSVEYIASDKYRVYQVGRYLASAGYRIDYKEIIEHSQRLARIAKTFRASINKSDPYNIWQIGSSLSSLLNALLAARHFVHFVSFGIDAIMIGALKMVAQNFPVRGVISNVKNKWLQEELTEHTDDARALNIKLSERDLGIENIGDLPHQKIIIIDGLIAFKGSANMTTAGWRKAAKGLDSIEVVTNINDVMELNNNLFSAVWKHLDSRTSIEMDDEVPF